MLNNKETLRAAYRSKRLDISPEQKQVLDEQMLYWLQQSSLFVENASYVHVFLPIAKWNEFNTFPFISWLRVQYPSIHIVVSTTDRLNGTLAHYVWQDETIAENAWGIPELVLKESSIEVEPSDIDIVFIPLLVCDGYGNRIGYGKGFYDRFLLECKSGVRKIGISYFSPVEQRIFTDPWDVALDSLITPEGLFHFKQEDA